MYKKTADQRKLTCSNFLSAEHKKCQRAVATKGGLIKFYKLLLGELPAKDWLDFVKIFFPLYDKHNWFMFVCFECSYKVGKEAWGQFQHVFMAIFVNISAPLLDMRDPIAHTDSKKHTEKMKTPNPNIE